MTTRLRGTLPLSGPTDRYDRHNQAELRRQIEQAIQDINADIDEVRTLNDKDMYYHVLRMQFLTMGVVHG